MDTFKSYDEFAAAWRTARREIIANDFPHLNPAQLEAALKTEGPVRIVAGAGSGKTATLVARTANILKYGSGSDTDEIPEDAEPEDLEALRACAAAGDTGPAAALLAAHARPRPWEVLVVTFTNKAAKELRQRLDAKIGQDGLKVHAMTFHALGVRLLRRFGPAVGIPSEFGICDEDDQARIVKSIRAAIAKDNLIQDPGYKDKEVVAAVSRLKHSLRDPDTDAMRGGMTPPDPAEWDDDYILLVYKAYRSLLEASNQLDFDDLVLRTYDMLGDPGVRAACQDLYKYVMVDEYQDTDPIQDAIIRILSGNTGNVCAVGDDDQSIYGFRGAQVDIFRRFDAYHPGTLTVRLEANYRSKGHIIGAANAVIANNKDRIGKDMAVTRDEGPKVRVHVLDDVDAESRFIAAQVKKNVEDGAKYADHLVLARTWRQVNALQRGFIDAMVPYEVPNGATFRTAREIKDLSAYLAVAADPADRFHLERIVLDYVDGVGPVAWEKILQAADEHHMGPLDAMGDEDVLKAARMARAIPACPEFVARVRDMAEAVASLPLPEAVERVTELSGLVEYWEDRACCAPSDEEEDKCRARIGNMKLLAELAGQYHEANEDTEEDTMVRFLSAMAIDDGTDAEPRDAVQLLTAHRAKGLEFPHVFVATMAEGCFPLDFDDVDQEEERRLFYVSMTRAMDTLDVTVPKHVRNFTGKLCPVRPSPLAREIPKSHAELLGH